MKKLLLSLLLVASVGMYVHADSVTGTSDHDTSYHIDIAKGNIGGTSVVHKYGRNTVLASSMLPVWDGGATDLTLPSTEAVMTCVSTSDEDAAGGDGASKITLQGLDDDYNLVSQELTLTGTTPLNTTVKFMRLYRMFVSGLGSGSVFDDTNEGIIDCDHGTDLMARIVAGAGQTLMAVWTTSANTKSYLTNFSASILPGTGTTAKTVAISLHFVGSDGINRVKHTEGLMTTGSSHVTHNFPVPLQIAEKTDVHIEAIVDSGTGNDVSASFEVIVVRED